MLVQHETFAFAKLEAESELNVGFHNKGFIRDPRSLGVLMEIGALLIT